MYNLKDSDTIFLIGLVRISHPATQIICKHITPYYVVINSCFSSISYFKKF